MYSTLFFAIVRHIAPSESKVTALITRGDEKKTEMLRKICYQNMNVVNLLARMSWIFGGPNIIMTLFISYNYYHHNDTIIHVRLIFCYVHSATIILFERFWQ